MRIVLGGITYKALGLGLLVRGGVALGPLYHQDGVVIGPAMIEAFTIESKISMYPRAVLSRGLVSECDHYAFRNHLIEDHDGLWHLDYFSGLAEVATEELGVGRLHDWRRTTMDMIETQIQRLGNAGQLGAASKWTYFKRQFTERVLPQYAEFS